MSEEVRSMFASISSRYDLLNGILSLGIHHRWRRIAVNMSGAVPGMSVLDCATGTGDLAIAFKKAVQENGEVTGSDFCMEMMASAPEKAKKKAGSIRWEVADVLNLPYEDARFDISSMAFGIRNVDDPSKAMQEMARVVKPSGKVVVLEFGQPYGIMKYPFQWYSRYIIPCVGGWISGNRNAYRYLPETSAAFPAGESFIHMMEQTESFTRIRCMPLMQGVAYVYVGTVR